MVKSHHKGNLRVGRSHHEGNFQVGRTTGGNLQVSRTKEEING